jgi:hypothetical protein
MPVLLLLTGGIKKEKVFYTLGIENLFMVQDHEISG